MFILAGQLTTYTAFMRFFGKHLSNWWLLLALPFISFLMVCAIGFSTALGGIFGPPAIWDRPKNVVSLKEIAGTYQQNGNLEPLQPHKAELDLNENGSMKVRNLLHDTITTKCIISGTGSWEIANDNQVILSVTAMSDPSDCAPGVYEMMEIAGRSSPHRLYWVLGDPDSGTGIWLSKR